MDTVGTITWIVVFVLVTVTITGLVGRIGFSAPVALATAAVLVGLALMLTGATVGVLSGGPPLRRALRQLAIGLGAAAVTYSLGLLFGTAVG